MQFLIDLTFEDRGYNAFVHFVAIFDAKDDREASLFRDELLAAFKRRDVPIFALSCNRMEPSSELAQRLSEFHQFFLSRATASIQIEQFHLTNPDQTKSLAENLTEKFFNRTNHTAEIGKRHNLPVRIYDKETRNPIKDEVYYFSIEHLIPRQ